MKRPEIQSKLSYVRKHYVWEERKAVKVAESKCQNGVAIGGEQGVGDDEEQFAEGLEGRFKSPVWGNMFCGRQYVCVC